MGALAGALTDYWLGRGGVADPIRLVIAAVIGIVVGILVDVGQLAHF